MPKPIKPQKPKSHKGSVLARRARQVPNVIQAAGMRLAYGGLGFPQFNQSPFPPRMRSQHPYSFNFGAATGVAGIYGTERAFRLNSVYDPDLTGVGVYPYAYAIMATIYNAYRVYRVDIDIVCTSPTADGVWCGAFLTSSLSGATLAGASLQTADGKQFIDQRPCNNTGAQVCQITRSFNVWDLDGLTKAEWQGNPYYCAAVGSNPASYPQLHVAIASAQSVMGTNAAVLIRINFHTEWYNRLAL